MIYISFDRTLENYRNVRDKHANTLHTHRFPSSLNKAHKMTFFILCKSKLKTLGENNLNA